MAADSDCEEDDASENEFLCGSCKRKIVKDCLTCIQCEKKHHKSCVVRLKSTKIISTDKILCCKVNPEDLLIKVVYLVKENESLKTERDLLMKLSDETSDKNMLLQEKIAELQTKQRTITYAEITKTKVGLPNQNAININVPKVIIKPKNNKNRQEIKEDLHKVMNPAKLKIGIKTIKTTQDGTTYIECSGTNEAQRLITEASDKMKEYTISMTTLRKPKIKIIGCSPNADKMELENAIKEQNSFINENDEINITYVHTKQNKSTIFAECSPNLFAKIIYNKKLYIGWERYPVYEDLGISRCFKCQSYNHKSKNCTSKVACSFCSEEHDLQACPKQAKKCVNCTVSNKKHQHLNLKTDHEVTSKDCPTYQFQINRLKARTDYGN